MQPRPLSLALLALAASLAAQGGTQSTSTPPTSQDGKTAIDWKDLTRSGIPIKFYGFFRFDAYYNTARMNSVVTPFTVTQENGVAAKQDDNEFFLDPRLTRFGFDVTPSKVGDTQVSGKLEIDFANFPAGVADSRATPRIRLAWIDVMGDEFGFRVGQDWDVISPLYPAVNSETLMWNAGNTGDRRPQIQGRYTPKESAFDVKAALGLTGAVSNEDLDTPTGQRDGYDSGMPNVQVRVGVKSDLLVEKHPAEFGLWGAVGETETDNAFGGKHRFGIWIAGLDASVPLSSELTFRGEAWTGQNLGDFRGAIGQSINTTTGEEIGATGGWGEIVFQATKQTRFHVGGTTDDPDNSDVQSGRPQRNIAGYVGTVVDWDCGVRSGLDVIYWETDWKGQGVGNTVRFDLYFQYNF